MAGAAGFEPTDAEIKTRCLTTWRRPYLTTTTTLTVYELAIAANHDKKSLRKVLAAICSLCLAQVEQRQKHMSQFRLSVPAQTG